MSAHSRQYNVLNRHLPQYLLEQLNSNVQAYTTSGCKEKHDQVVPV